MGHWFDLLCVRFTGVMAQIGFVWRNEKGTSSLWNSECILLPRSRCRERANARNVEAIWEIDMIRDRRTAVQAGPALHPQIKTGEAGVLRRNRSLILGSDARMATVDVNHCGIISFR